MSLRFACPHCRQKLSVSANKAGVKTACPKCKKSLVVPHSPSSGSSSAIGALASVPPPTSTPGAPAPAYDQFEVYDDDTEIIYDTDSAASHPAGTPSLQDRILLPRWAIYAQGGLLAGLSFICFVIGLLAGGLGAGSGQPAGPQSYDLYGRVAYELAQRQTGDDGAFILALPQNKVPDEKAPTANMFPTTAPAAHDHRGLEIVRQLGGGHTRADKDGNFKLNLPRGDYFVLVISNIKDRSGGSNVPITDVAQLGRFLETPVDFIGRRMYRWEKVSIKGNQRFDVFFE